MSTVECKVGEKGRRNRGNPFLRQKQSITAWSHLPYAAFLSSFLQSNNFFFANKIHFFANFVAFSPSGVSFSPSGGDPIAPLHCCLSLRSWNATHGRYLPQCAGEVHYPHQRLFKLMTGGAATAGTGGRHVGHAFESQRLTNSGPKPETQV